MSLGADVYVACGGDGGPDYYTPKAAPGEMPPEALRVLIAEAMHWTLDYTDSLELRERLEVLTVLNARTAAHSTQPEGDD